nr:MAG TPA: hypothetical protein [Caudoviricetes sp.]
MRSSIDHLNYIIDNLYCQSDIFDCRKYFFVLS